MGEPLSLLALKPNCIVRREGLWTGGGGRVYENHLKICGSSQRGMEHVIRCTGTFRGEKDCKERKERGIDKKEGHIYRYQRGKWKQKNPEKKLKDIKGIARGGAGQEEKEKTHAGD